MVDPSATLPIASVARDTGLSQDTLRVWERRYGFPTPERDAFGERAYSLAQLEKLRLIKRLLDSGQRPGRIVAQPMDELARLSVELANVTNPDKSNSKIELRSHLELIRSHDVEGLRRNLAQAQLRLGLAGFVSGVVAPLNVMVGEAWSRGELDVFEEHLYTECVQMLLRNGISSARQPELDIGPRVMLTTFPQEPHGLGLLMAETILTLEGCPCLSLGTQTPIHNIVRAATAYRADIVALSFTASISANAVFNGLAELRQALPATVGIWAGGHCPALQRRDAPGVQRIGALSDIQTQIAHWRAVQT